LVYKITNKSQHIIDAAEDGNELLIKALLEKGADVNAKDNLRRTPLWVAAEKGYEAVVKLLLDTGKAELNAKDRVYYKTPVWIAAEKEHEAVVKMLLDTGKADVNMKSCGRTPLSWAAQNGHEAVVKLLLDTGKADVNVEDSFFGRTPLSRAAENGHEAVVNCCSTRARPTLTRRIISSIGRRYRGLSRMDTKPWSSCYGLLVVCSCL
jgi:ankyrin repeat protein